MKVKGNLNLLGNLLQNANLEVSKNWPATDPGVGRLLLKEEGTGNYRFYISAGLQNGARAWIPLSQELSMYVHDQGTAASTWTINHPLQASSVIVQVMNTSNEIILTDSIKFAFNKATVEFTQPQAGRAILIATSLEGVMRPNVAYTNDYTAQATWTVNHMLGYEPIVRCFIGNQEVQPLSITHTDANTAVVQWSAPQAGRVKCL